MDYFGMRFSTWHWFTFAVLIFNLATHRSPFECIFIAACFAYQVFVARVEWGTLELRRETWRAAQGTPFADVIAKRAMDEALR